MLKLYNIFSEEYISGGCLSRKWCSSCQKYITCDSSGKAGTEDKDNIYIWGPCCCGLWKCPQCTSGLIVEMNSPKFPEKIPSDKRFKNYVFYVYRQADIKNFKKLVEEKGGMWVGAFEVPFLNNWNEPVSTQYACHYCYQKELHMAIMC